jgi:anti-sigma factor RsiW
MTCAECRLQLDDIIDGEYAASEPQAEQLAALEAHLRGCAACRAVEAQLRELIARAAALPPRMSPPRDLWPDIAQRVRRAPAQVQTHRPWTRFSGLAAAAGVVLALSGVFALRGAEQRRVLDTTSTTGISMRTALSPVGVLLPEREYERATAALMEAVEARREMLSPETHQVVTRNLRVIDDALAELRSALDSDPGNDELASLFSSTQRRKVAVLQRVVRLSL